MSSNPVPLIPTGSLGGGLTGLGNDANGLGSICCESHWFSSQ